MLKKLVFVLLFGIIVASGCIATAKNTAENNSLNQSQKSANGFSGAILAGSKAPLLNFTKADYEKAVASDKLVVLYFYANWCPICKAEFPEMQSAFNDLQTDRVIGFRVNFNDSDTDAEEQALAWEFGVAYQHTKVFLKNGQRVLKSPEGWDKQRYLREINNNIG